jgi:hypothetical protein
MVAGLAAARQRRAWEQAVLWLHGRGLPAAVPEDLTEWLRRRGAGAEWHYPRRTGAS